MRDEFPVRVKDVLAKRSGHRCSNPSCQRETSGPHSDPTKAVNIGVAAHITAASPGGPRFDFSLSPVERVQIENAIWLCQTCATLVDTDVVRFTVEVLHQWKEGTERIARWKIESTKPLIGEPNQHPAIGLRFDMTYDDARALLIRDGWQPYMRHWNHGWSPDVRYGNGPVFWERGYHELAYCSGTGYAFCRFEFMDANRNKLVVVTAGEEENSVPCKARVVRWFFENTTSPSDGLDPT